MHFSQNNELLYSMIYYECMQPDRSNLENPIFSARVRISLSLSLSLPKGDHILSCILTVFRRKNKAHVKSSVKGMKMDPEKHFMEPWRWSQNGPRNQRVACNGDWSTRFSARQQ